MPTSGHLTLDIAPATSALERLLAVVRRRGYAVDAMTAERGDDNRLTVQVTVSGERRLGILARHLDNLGDCRLLQVRADGSADHHLRSS